MILNYQLHHHETSTVSPMIFIHGLFGSLSNLGVLARHFSEQRTVIQIDVRNHGLSGHSSDINYQLMAEDVLETLSSLNVHKFVVVGHSMGGKIAMKLADLAREQTEKLIVLDITPIQYHESHHTEIFLFFRSMNYFLSNFLIIFVFFDQTLVKIDIISSLTFSCHAL